MVYTETTVGEVVRRFRPSKYHAVLAANKAMRVLERVTETQILETMHLGNTTKSTRELLSSART